MKKFIVIILLLSIVFLITCTKKIELDIKTGFAEVNGTRLYYEVGGKSEPIVLIHGNLGDCRYWDQQFKVFAKSNKVVRYDVRGFGKSSLPVEGEPYSHHEDLKALLEYLDIPKAHIAGLSMGCGLAVDFVLAYPQMSSSLIAVGPWVMGYSSPSAENFFKEWGKIGSVLKESGKKEAAKSFTNAPFFHPQKMSPKLKDKLTEIVNDYSFWQWLNKNPAYYVSPRAIEQIDKINLPTLIITAEYDIESCREIADLLEKTIPKSKKLDITDATHFMLMEKPAEFNKGVLQFLSQINK